MKIQIGTSMAAWKADQLRLEWEYLFNHFHLVEHVNANILWSNTVIKSIISCQYYLIYTVHTSRGGGGDLNMEYVEPTCQVEPLSGTLPLNLLFFSHQVDNSCCVLQEGAL